MHAALAHVLLHEGQGTRSRLEVTDGDDVEVVSRVMGAGAVRRAPPAGRGAWPTAPAPTAAIEVSPAALGQPHDRGARRSALTSPWAGYRWGPVLAARPRDVRPADAGPRAVGGEAPQPLGLIGAHRSRRDGEGSEFSSIRAFHSGDRLRRINWRVSLRQGTLHVESTRAEEDTAVLLIVDALADYGVSEGVGAPRAASTSPSGRRRRSPSSTSAVATGSSLRVLSPGGEYAGVRHRHQPPAADPVPAGAGSSPGIPRDVEIDRIDFRATAGTVVVVLSPMLSERSANATVRAGPPRPAGDRGRPARRPTRPRWCGPTATSGSRRWPGGCGCSTATHLLESLAAARAARWCRGAARGPSRRCVRRLARRAQLPRVGGA